MNFHKRRDIFLATCLLESIEDENYRNTRKLLVDHNADPNLLIPESNIAPIHYAAGMENTSFAEAAMKLILKCNGNPNVQTIDGETPLHIAVIWNRSLIVEMLLDHGADFTIKDNDNNTPINHAISERHYNLIPIFQNYAFEKKLQKKTSDGTPKKPDRTPNKSLTKVINSIRSLEISKNPNNDNLLTPNRTNFNFNEASPFLIQMNPSASGKRLETNKTESNKTDSKPSRARRNITKNENKTNVFEPKSEDKDEIIVISDSDDNDDIKEHAIVRNLFELTQENIEKHLSMRVKKTRKDSLIHIWRNKVNESRSRASILPINETEFEAFISENTCESTTVESSHQSVETVIEAAKSKPCNHDNGTEDSFFTAADSHADGMIDSAAINNPNELLSNQKTMILDRSENTTNTIFQTEELYKHFDPESNILFYENKILSNVAKIATKAKIDHDAVSLNTSSETGTCTDFAVPSDYDTDDLRKELKAFGEVPGPITKNTKRLYLKRLIRYQRRPQEMLNNLNFKCNFSVELQRTMRNDIESLNCINEYAPLERQMINSFHANSGKNMREGNYKKSFIYLLIDPRIADNLLADAQHSPMSELWCRFLKSIYYVGKGKSSRPYAHLYDAIKLYHDKTKEVDKVSKYQESLKLHRIIEIWQANKGVVCLPVFHNIMPVEAYTREAAIIDCLGVENLTNIKRGDYYGVSKSWTMRDRKRLGVLLLYKAMQVFMVEGESQLRPSDIK